MFGLRRLVAITCLAAIAAGSAVHASTSFEATLLRVTGTDSPKAAREAFDAIRKASPASADAALACGLLASTPGSVVHSRAVALECLERAAAAGLAPAQLRLAELLLEGEPSYPDRAAAGKWLAQSAQLPESVYQIALMRADTAQDPVAARQQVIARAAEAGFAQAQFELARLLRSKDDAASRAQSTQWLARAAAQGHADAAAETALLLAAQKREADIPRVVELLQRASAGGSTLGRYELGRRYLEALGVGRDTVRGFELTRASAHGGHLEAQYAIGTLLSQGIGTGSDEAAALDWFRFASARGHRDAMFAIGTSYANGWGVGTSFDLAYQWYCRAAQAGHAQARAMVERRAPGGCPAR